MKQKSFTAILAFAAALLAPVCAQESGPVLDPDFTGYMNINIPPGYTPVGIQLRRPELTLGAYFADLPAGARILRLTPDGYDIITAAGGGVFTPAAAASEPISVGEGVLIHNPGTQSFTLTLAGEIPYGTLTNHIPAGLSLLSGMIPMEATPAELGFDPVHLDLIFRLHPQTGKFESFIYLEPQDRWIPPLEPINVGEAFFIRTSQARDWVIQFAPPASAE